MNLRGLLDQAGELLELLKAERIRDTVMNLDERGFMILLGVTAVLVVVCLIKRMIRTATLILTLFAVTVLLHFTIPEEGEAMRFNQIVTLFVGGSAIVGSAVYFIFIRSD